MRPSQSLPALMATLMLASGCAAGDLKGLLVAGAAAAGGTGASPAASSAPATPAPVASTAATPSTAPTASQAPAADPQAGAKFAAFQAKVDAASDDPEKICKLFVAAFANYKADKDLALAMMPLAASDGERQADAKSPSGYSFPQARSIYWRGVDRQPGLPFVYFDSEQNAVSENAEDHVVIDADYKAVDKGIEGKLATYYLKVSGDSGTRSRPIRATLTAEGWRVSNYSSIVVPI